MASNAYNVANIAPYIPEIWSTIVLAATEAELVFAPHVDRRFEAELTKGDVIHVPNYANMGGAQVVDYNVELTLYEAAQTCTNIIVNYHYYQAVGLGEQEDIQEISDFLKTSLQKCGYDIGLIIDDKLNQLVLGFTDIQGTEGSALTADVLINCYESLNGNNCPEGDRVWIFDHKSISDLMKLDYFIRYDYVPEGVVAKGFQNRQIFGAPVYMTSNLNVVNTSYHAATYMHRQALALVTQMAPTAFAFDWPQKFTKAVGVKSLFGVAEIRDTFGCWIATRN